MIYNTFDEKGHDMASEVAIWDAAKDRRVKRTETGPVVAYVTAGEVVYMMVSGLDAATILGTPDVKILGGYGRVQEFTFARRRLHSVLSSLKELDEELHIIKGAHFANARGARRGVHALLSERVR